MTGRHLFKTKGKLLIGLLPLLISPVTAFATISVNCESVTNAMQCTFTGTGTNLSSLLSQAVLQKSNNLILIIATSNTLNPMSISNANNITLHLNAGVTLSAPPYGNSSWKNQSALINVRNVHQFTLSGDSETTSIIDGTGNGWWAHPTLSRPNLLSFQNGTGLTVTDLRIQNSPMYHLFIENSQTINIYNMAIVAPATSPNTDGVHAKSVQHMLIDNISIDNGDDGIAVNADASPETTSTDIQLNNITLTNGHGISIGSGVFNNVSNMSVNGVTITNAQYGLRIKTRCDQTNCSDTNNVSVSGISYNNITMTGVHYPILYMLNYKTTDGRFSNVALGNISYANITATGSNHPAALLCESQNGCSSIQFTNVSIDSGSQCQGIDGGSYTKVVPCPFS